MSTRAREREREERGRRGLRGEADCEHQRKKGDIEKGREGQREIMRAEKGKQTQSDERKKRRRASVRRGRRA